MEKKILIDNLGINYKIAGQGPAILILHGWNGSSDSWIRVSEILAQNGFLVVSPDFPGFGKSETPKNSWDLKDFVNWLKNFVDILKLEKFFLLGHSFGGRVAIKFSIIWPEKVRALILVNSAGIKQKWGLREKVVFQLAKIGNALFSPNIFLRFRNRLRDIFYRIFRLRDWANAKGVMKETMKKVIEEDLLPELEKLKVKTFILWGQNDKIIPVRNAYIFKEKIKDSELKILPKVEHSPHLEHPEKLVEAILEFINL